MKPSYRSRNFTDTGMAESESHRLPSQSRFRPGRRKIPFVALVPFLLLTCVLAQDKGKKDEAAKEEKLDYFEKWLKEDVVYIITEEEKEVFEKLSTPEEKEQFIEQFWFRRDPDLKTAANEFKEEHYRRIAYANDHYFSSKPGWMTDRGRIYIIHGPPAEVESHPSGGPYERPIWEGGGSTITYPFEIWRYRYIEGIGPDVEMLFVDPSMTREYRLSYKPEEKDALLTTPGVGLTLAEEDGGATRLDRPYRNHDARINQGYPGMFQRAQDSPFERYKRYVKLQRAPEIRYKDLKEIVDVNVSYESLPVQVRQDFIRLDETRMIVPVTVKIANQELSFDQEGTNYTAHLGIYGLVKSISNRVVEEFEDDVRTSFPASTFQEGLGKSSIYQKVLILERKGRYKLDLVVKDMRSNKVGTVRKAIVPPAFPAEGLGKSSLILSDYIRPLAEIPKEDQMFVIGNVWIRPSIEKVFWNEGDFGIYLQVYGVQLDQATYAPDLRITYSVKQNGQTVRRQVDEAGESVQFYSGQRVVLIKRMPLSGLAPGQYTVQVKVEDKVGNRTLQAEDRFRIEKSLSHVAMAH